MTSASREVKQALKAVQARVRQRAGQGSPSGAAVQGPTTAAVLKTAEEAIAADERFEHLDPAGDLLKEFAAACSADRQSDHVRAFMERHGHDASAEVCFLGVERLSVEEATEIAGVRLLPLGHPDIPDSPLFRADPLIASVAAVPVTGTNKVLMAARARRAAEHALRVLRIGLRQQDRGLHPMQLRFRIATSHAFAGSAGGWDIQGDVALPSKLPAALMGVILATPVAGLPAAAPKKSINEKALLAVEWLDRAVFMPDPLVATLFRFFALEALLGDKSSGLKNGLITLRQMTLSAIANNYWFHPDDTFLQYDQVRSYAVHGEIAPPVTEQQAAEFAWVVRDTLDQYLAIASSNGFTKRSELLDLLDNYPRRQELITWIRERGSPEWNSYLDSITVSPDANDRPAGGREERDPAGEALAGEPAPTGGVEHGLDQEPCVAVVDAGVGVTKDDDGPADEAGSEL